MDNGKTLEVIKTSARNAIINGLSSEVRRGALDATNINDMQNRINRLISTFMKNDPLLEDGDLDPTDILNDVYERSGVSTGDSTQEA
jgi:hypothetical protein